MRVNHWQSSGKYSLQHNVDVNDPQSSSGGEHSGSRVGHGIRRSMSQPSINSHFLVSLSNPGESTPLLHEVNQGLPTYRAVPVQGSGERKFSPCSSDPEIGRRERHRRKIPKEVTQLAQRLGKNFIMTTAINAIGLSLAIVALHIPPCWPVIGIFTMVGTFAPEIVNPVTKRCCGI